jgi:hypothetical protein
MSDALSGEIEKVLPQLSQRQSKRLATNAFTLSTTTMRIGITYAAMGVVLVVEASNDDAIGRDQSREFPRGLFSDLRENSFMLSAFGWRVLVFNLVISTLRTE